MGQTTKIKKFLHHDINTIELQQVFITEKTFILRNDDNNIDFKSENDYIQYNLIINGYELITYYESEMNQAYDDYETLLKQKTMKDEIIRSQHEYDSMYD